MPEPEQPNLTAVALLVPPDVAFALQHHAAELLRQLAPSTVASMDQAASTINDQIGSNGGFGVSPQSWVMGDLVTKVLRDRFPELRVGGRETQSD